MQLNFLDQPMPKQLSSGFPDSMVILDCETTGGQAIHHRIIEIGLVVIEQGKLVETWQSFIDPNVQIPPFIQKLTGISPGMLVGAPAFSDIAQTLLKKLEGRTLVAHNARFDYSFLKNEFDRVGIRYNAKPLCSVKFSRNLYPQFRRHGLSQIIQRFELAIENRHRALDDAQMVYQFFQKSSALFSDDEIAATCQALLKRPALPTLLKAKDVEKLPAAAGVYYFYDEKGALLYVGKSVHIRNRVMSHFSSDHKNPKDLQMSTKIAHVDFERTPSDFGAQIRESSQIKELAPLYNRRLRKVKKLYQIRSRTDDAGYLRLSVEIVETADTQVDEQFGLFRSARQASKKLEALADQYFLCHKLMNLEGSQTSNHPCFRAQLKKCFGACHGKEIPELYNERTQAALKNYQVKTWPYPGPILLEERDPNNLDNVMFHVVDRWRYVAKLALLEDIYDYGYQLAQAQQQNTAAAKGSALLLGTQPSNQSESQLQISAAQLEQHHQFDLDTYFILVRFLVNQKKTQVNGLKVWPLVAIATPWQKLWHFYSV